MIEFDDTSDSLSLRLFGEALGVTGLETLLAEIFEDNTSLDMLDMGYNVSADEAEQPSKMERLMKLLYSVVVQHPKLMKLSLIGNHMFDNSPHPSNQHGGDYFETLVDLLMKSAVKDLDISDNNVIGSSGRQLSGLGVFTRKVGICYKADDYK
jgi:hypothetical protein